MRRVVDINRKKKRKPLTAKEAVTWAKQKTFNKRPPEDEPQDLISGKTAPDGGFVNEDDGHEERQSRSNPLSILT
jgi:hypothetical protein